MIVEVIAQRIRTGSPSELRFAVKTNEVYMNAMRALIQQVEKDGSGFYKLTLERHVPGRTKAQQSEINARIRDIAEDLGYEFDELKYELKVLAVSRGWPIAKDDNGEDRHDQFGRPVPASEAYATAAHASALIDTIDQWEAENYADRS